MTDRIEQLTVALQSLVDHYTGLVNSGDAGNWDPETEPAVIAAREALARPPAAPEGEPVALIPVGEVNSSGNRGPIVRWFPNVGTSRGRNVFITDAEEVYTAPPLADRAARAPVAAEETLTEAMRLAQVWRDTSRDPNASSASMHRAAGALRAFLASHLATPSGEPKPEPVAAQLARALKELRDLFANNPTMQGREYVGIGIAANNALAAFERAAEPVSPTSAGEMCPMTLAALGHKHFGNPIPAEWYAAAKELITIRDALARPAAPAHPVALKVWFGSMPESNGRMNWTVMLHRADQHSSEGITFDRSEYHDRVRYGADRLRHLIGELPTEPDILAYDADLHSGYVEAQPTPAPAEATDACVVVDVQSRVCERGTKCCSVYHDTPAPGAPVSRDAVTPTAWVRFCSDGTYEGPLMDIDPRMAGARKTSGAWTPLFLAATPGAPAPVQPLNDDTARLDWIDATVMGPGVDFMVARVDEVPAIKVDWGWTNKATGNTVRAAIDAARASEGSKP